MNKQLATALVVLASSGCFQLPYYGGDNTTPTRQQPPLGGGGGGFFFTDGGGTATGGGAFCGSSDEQGVTKRGPTPRPLSGGTMAALSNGGLVIADPDRARVWLASAGFQMVRSVQLEVGDEPGRVVEGAPGIAYVALRRTSQLAEIDFAAGTLRRLETCAYPRGLAWRSSDAQLVVACLGGHLETVDPATEMRHPIATTVPLEDLRDVVIDADRLVVTTFRSSKLYAIATDGSVTPIVGPRVDGFEPRVAWRAIPRRGGGLNVVHQHHRSTTLPDANNCSAYGGFDPSANIVTSELLTVSGTTVIPTPLADGFESVVLPVDVAVSPTGRLAVLSAGTGQLVQFEPGFRRSVFLTDHGLDSQLTSVVFVGEDAFVFQREPAQVWRVDPTGTASLAFTIAGVSSVNTGHELFHRATPANIACASCHPEAGDDGHTWNFAEGARRTPGLRGGLGGTAPFHWTGDMADMDTLMANVMSLRMSGPKLTPEGSGAVQDWLHIQPSLPPPAVDPDAALRGASVFSSAGCAVCHSGVQGTNNQTMAVGTGLALQVPRLTEFAWRGPWLHDGRMARVEDRFQPLAGGDLHGITSTLDEAQRSDLLEYLKTR